MEDRIKIWFTLVCVGTALGFVAVLVAKSARISEAWGWVTGISIFLNFFLAGMVGNARNAAQRANEVMAAMYDRMSRNINPEPIYVEQPRRTTFGTTDFDPPAEHISLPPEEAERIGKESDEAERRRKEEEYLKTRKTAGFEQGHHKRSSTTLSAENYYYHPVTGEYRHKSR